MSKHHDRNKMLNQILHADRLQQLLAPTEADLAEVEAMSEAELDEELAAAGIDYAAFAARLQQTLADHEAQSPTPALPAGLAWLTLRGRRWLQATFDGLEDLRRGCAPMAPVLDAGLRETLPAALQAAGSGRLSRAQILKVINEHVAQIQACYERVLARDRSLAGKITFDWVISPTGSVESVRVRSSTMSSTAISSCIMQEIRGWTFPTPEGGSVSVTYPYIFNAQSF